MQAINIYPKKIAQLAVNFTVIVRGLRLPNEAMANHCTRNLNRSLNFVLRQTIALVGSTPRGDERAIPRRRVEVRSANQSDTLSIVLPTVFIYQQTDRDLVGKPQWGVGGVTNGVKLTP